MLKRRADLRSTPLPIHPPEEDVPSRAKTSIEAWKSQRELRCLRQRTLALTGRPRATKMALTERCPSQPAWWPSSDAIPARN